jgi:alkylhydroperoxidase family enzyme
LTVREVRWALLGVFVLVSAACPKTLPPNATPQMKMAKYAGDVMAGVREVQRVTAALEAGRVVTEAQAADVMAVSIKIGRAGTQLASALTLYNAAVDLASRKLALADALEALDTIDRELKVLLKPLDGSGAKAQFVDVVTEIIKAAWTVRMLLPAGGVA